MSCCPPGRTPALTVPTEYKTEGKFENVEGVNTYIVGDSKKGKAVIVIADIFGITTGRHYAICDQLASELGCFVVGPDLFGGKKPEMSGIMDFIKINGVDVFQPQLDKVYAYLKKMGIESSAMMGMCYGSWVIFHESARGSPISCGVNCHPSLRIEEMFKLGKIEELAEKSQHPMLMFPCLGDPETKEGADSESLCEGGAVEKILQAKKYGKQCNVVNFGEKHGFVSQGDVTNERVAKAVEKAMTLSVEFFKANM